MNIPDKAVEAAAYALDDYWGGRYAPHVLEELSDEMRAVLEAAAPHIAAQVLRDFADEEFRRDGATLVVERLLAGAEGIEPYVSLTNS